MFHLKRLLILSIFVFSAACTRYGVKNANMRHNPEAQILLSDPIKSASTLVEKFLLLRGFQPQIHRSLSNSQIDFECSWVRDTSLEYYYIDSGVRKRHLVHWKSVWRLKKQNDSSLLQVKIMELIFMGPQEESGKFPTLNGQWVEAPDSTLRAWLELRRFYTTYYSQNSLPQEMSQLNVPNLDFAPLSKEGFRPEQLYRTPRSFSF